MVQGISDVHFFADNEFSNDNTFFKIWIPNNFFRKGLDESGNFLIL